MFILESVEEGTRNMINTILSATIYAVLIYRCYKLECEVYDIKVKHNELVKIVSNNADVLDVAINEIDDIIQDIYGEEEIVNEN